MSNNKLLTSGPYSGMSIEEVVSADPWYIVSLVRAGGNHGISAGTLSRAERIIEENEKDEHDAYDELIEAQATALGYDLEFDDFERQHGG